MWFIMNIQIMYTSEFSSELSTTEQNLYSTTL